MNIKTCLLVIAVFAIIFASMQERTSANASAQSGSDALICNDDIRKAMILCWERTQNGQLNIEFGFSVVKGGSAYNIAFSRNDRLYFRARIFVLSDSLAVFHVHPNRVSPELLPNDKELARRINKPIYTITDRGIYCYYPDSSKTIKLKDFPEWTRPCRGEPVVRPLAKEST